MEDDVYEYKHTMAELSLFVGENNITENEDVWSKTIRDSVLVSAYPLAEWFATSWWRLIYEPLPSNHKIPTIDWRITHELGSANHGFVWPRVLFASDKEVVQIWSAPSTHGTEQSVRYVNGLETPAAVTLTQFQNTITSFIGTVIARLRAVDLCNTPLEQLWSEVQQEILDPSASQYRRLEAEMGFDPDECPEGVMKTALELISMMGDKTLSELAPVYGKSNNNMPLSRVREIIEAPGLSGTPNLPKIDNKSRRSNAAPWQRAVDDARLIREKLDVRGDLLTSSILCDLLGLRTADIEQWVPAERESASIARPELGNKLKFVPRKKHPMAKRFELARFVGDILFVGKSDKPWLATTDLLTSRQKYQRAFAAELLCPIQNLTEFLDDDYSESAIEEATSHFQVSTETVTALLSNNGLISPPLQSRFGGPSLPYHTGR